MKLLTQESYEVFFRSRTCGSMSSFARNGKNYKLEYFHSYLAAYLKASIKQQMHVVFHIPKQSEDKHTYHTYIYFIYPNNEKTSIPTIPTFIRSYILKTPICFFILSQMITEMRLQISSFLHSVFFKKYIFNTCLSACRIGIDG